MMDVAVTHGWSGIALAYAAVQVPMIAGLIRARAQLHHYFLSPLVAAPLTAVAAVGAVASSSLLAHLGFASHGLVQLTVGAGLSVVLGYVGGASAAPNGEDEVSHRRGALVADHPPARRSRSPARAAEITAAGRPLLINFTASWCLTCLVNERNAFSDEAVQAVFRDKGVTLMKGDWTNRDPAITKALSAFGRAGVPLYVVYNANPGSPEPLVLPQLLTATIVHDAFVDSAERDLK